MKLGQVKYYDVNVDLGLIEPQDQSRDVTFQGQVVEGIDPSLLRGGENVEYDSVSSRNGPIATRVIVC